MGIPEGMEKLRQGFQTGDWSAFQRWVGHFFVQVVPVIVGDGKRALPDGVRAQLELLAERRFRSGVVHLHYGLRGF